MISVKNVSYSYKNGTPILRDISLQAQPGKVHALVGPNGAGKSTLMKLISGDLTPTSGSIQWFGKDLESIPLRERARMRAIMLQHSSVSFPFSVLETVALGRTPYNNGKATKKDVALAVDALSQVEALDLAHKVYTELSGGERQRVNLARALAQIHADEDMPERFLLLDEPTASLDVFRQQTLLQLLRTPAFQKLGVFIIIHDINLAARFADRITVLNEKGQATASGSPWDIITGNIILDTFKVHVRVERHPDADCPLVII